MSVMGVREMAWRGLAVSCLLAGAALLAPLPASATIVAAVCYDTGDVGLADGYSEALAAEKALKICSNNAGSDNDGCCSIQYTSDSKCLAVATTGPGGSIGYGEGDSHMEATDSSVENCASSGCRSRHVKCSR